MPERTVSVLRTHDDREVPVAGVYEIDGAHTSVEFVGRHLMITKVRGRFSDVTRPHHHRRGARGLPCRGRDRRRQS